jgi:hypothetical protein
MKSAAQLAIISKIHFGQQNCCHWRIFQSADFGPFVAFPSNKQMFWLGYSDWKTLQILSLNKPMRLAKNERSL